MSTFDENRVCDSCKRYVDQRIGGYKGWATNLAAHGCDKRNKTGVPCERNDVIRYLFKKLKESEQENRPDD